MYCAVKHDFMKETRVFFLGNSGLGTIPLTERNPPWPLPPMCQIRGTLKTRVSQGFQAHLCLFLYTPDGCSCCLLHCVKHLPNYHFVSVPGHISLPVSFPVLCVLANAVCGIFALPDAAVSPCKDHKDSLPSPWLGLRPFSILHYIFFLLPSGWVTCLILMEIHVLVHRW